MNLRQMNYAFNARYVITRRYCKKMGWDKDNLTNEQAKIVRELPEYKKVLKKITQGY